MSALDALRSFGRPFASDRRGAVVVEFAIVLPLILLIYLGGFDAMRLVRAFDKTQTAAKTIADLTAQEPTGNSIPASEVALLLSAAGAAATPYNDGNLHVSVSAIDLKLKANGLCCDATVRWSATQGGSLMPCETTLTQTRTDDAWSPSTIPVKIASQSLVVVSGVQTWAPSVIVVDISYTSVSLTPLVSTFATRTLWQHAYAIPRLNGQITVTSSGSLPADMTGLNSGQTGKVCS